MMNTKLLVTVVVGLGLLYLGTRTASAATPATTPTATPPVLGPRGSSSGGTSSSPPGTDLIDAAVDFWTGLGGWLGGKEESTDNSWGSDEDSYYESGAAQQGAQDTASSLVGSIFGGFGTFIGGK